MMRPAPSTLSVIIPALNEQENVAAAVESAARGREVEVIVVDGGSGDKTAEFARAQGARVLVSRAGRAWQMNAGAAVATGQALLFLHADTRLPPGFDGYVRHALARPHTVAGAFELLIDAQSNGLRLIERLANWRARYLHMPYGDQAIFARADVFRNVGGFPEIPIMEDFELMRRLRKQGRILIVPSSVLTSGRRWQDSGIWRTTLRNQAAIVGHCCGVSPRTLARWRKQGEKKPRWTAEMQSSP